MFSRTQEAPVENYEQLIETSKSAARVRAQGMPFKLNHGSTENRTLAYLIGLHDEAQRQTALLTRIAEALEQR